MKDFLIENGFDWGLIEPAMRTLEPFFRIAETGQHSLKERSDLKYEEVARAISLATGQEVRNIEFVSLSHPFWAPDRIRWADDDSLTGDIYCRLKKRYRDNKWLMISWLWLDKGVLVNSLSGSLHRGLEDSFRPSLNCDKPFSYYPCDNLGYWKILEWSLSAYLFSVLAGDREEMERLTPLLELLPHAIPLGDTTDGFGYWLVLCA
ncbi:hypothetical protein AMJ57_02535 [Parcubacteria bacterium SG8_24]|nr:MAG: hypothetical protein AMJ57_02535 [Parcubacteria bacterium SG8_24]